jgi:SAM-dependent methyltransferase
VWRRKPGLRAVYRRYFRRLRAEFVAGWPVVEIGSGPGFLKEFCPDIVSTDVLPNPYADRVIDAAAMPFAAGEVGTVVLVDVFHHLPRPDLFLEEVARVLKPHGRLLMIEPWMGLAGWLFHRFIHHEDCDLSVHPEAPWGEDSKDPMAGNAALPYLYFRAGGQREHLPLPLRHASRALRRASVAAERRVPGRLSASRKSGGCRRADRSCALAHPAAHGAALLLGRREARAAPG